MKRILLIICLTLLLGLSYAQKSLFDIEFGAPIAETETMLKAQGFEEIGRTEDRITYLIASINNLSALEINLNAEKTQVAGWRVEYDLSLDPDGENDFVAGIIDQLIEIHGEAQVEYDFDCDYIWYFPGGKALYITVYSGDLMELFYADGNYDDDASYYEDY